jgi:hypothetical protein
MSSQIHDPGVLSRYDDYEIRPDHLIQRVPNERRRYAMVSLVVNEVLDRSELVDISDAVALSANRQGRRVGHV